MAGSAWRAVHGKWKYERLQAGSARSMVELVIAA